MLPDNAKMKWPPAHPNAVDYASWAAWYSGVPGELGRDAAPRSYGLIQRAWFWFTQKGRAESDKTPSAPKAVHVPLAGDIAQTSADLLFGEQVDLLLPNAAKQKKAQARLEELVDLTGLHNDLLESAETCAAMSGVFTRVTWDKDLCDYPFLTTVQPDQAIAKFAYDTLNSVTFWRVVDETETTVLRHLECHTKGKIEHGLYKGTKDELGVRVDLTSSKSTELLEPEVKLPDGLDWDVWYTKNVGPNQRDRSSPFGRADIQGCETFLDALDETYSSLMRDIRVGKARILVPSDSLDSAVLAGQGSRGGGRSFDFDREVFTELDGLDPKATNAFNPVEFQIRTEEHLAAAVDLIEKVTSKAGYSPQTFGLHIEGRADSGTALRIREEKTFRTLSRKRRYWAPTIASATEAMLIVDREVFGRIQPGGGKDLRPMLGWPKEKENVGEQAVTLQALRVAEAASTETLVSRLNPDWDEDKITAEVERIQQERGTVVPEPAF